MITSDRQIKDFNLLHRIVPEEVPEDDDEIMRVIPKPGVAAGAATATGGGASAAKPAPAQAAKGAAAKPAGKK